MPCIVRLSVAKGTPYDIPKGLVWEAYLRVKANGGSAGIDQESLGQLEENLSNNLYKLWGGRAADIRKRSCKPASST